jgi:Tol biopolymer transport system component
MSALAVLSVFGVCAPAAFAVFPGANGRIAFTAELFGGPCDDCYATGQTAWIAAPGERPMRLGPTSSEYFEIAFSPFGGRLLYLDRQGAIVVMRSDGSGRRLLSGPAVSDAAWSPLGDTVAYTDRSGLVLADGGAPRQIFAGADTADVVWSPTATRLAFTQWGPGGRRVRVIRSDGQLVRELGRGYAPDWSASGWLSYMRGSSLVGISGVQAQEEVLVRGMSGDQYQTRRDYSWSPDGHHIAFGANDRLWVKRARGARRRPLTRGRSWGVLGWSPDGRLVAYDRTKGFYNRNNGIYVVPARGGQSKPLARYPRAASGESATAFDWQARPRR